MAAEYSHDSDDFEPSPESNYDSDTNSETEEKKDARKDVQKDTSRDVQIDVQPGTEHDMCIICHQYVVVPVLLAQNCPCSQTICFFCFSQYIGMDKGFDHVQASRVKCLICKKPLKDVAVIGLCNVMPRHYITELDRKYGNVRCQHCEEWSGSRTELIDKHMGVCLKVYAPCVNCKKVKMRGNHQYTCGGCGTSILRCQRSKHENNECIAVEKCATCTKSLASHKHSACEFCNCRLILCPGKTAVMHYNECPDAYKDSSKWYDINKPEEFCYKCPKCVCWIPKSVSKTMHMRVCITFRTMKLSI